MATLVRRAIVPVVRFCGEHERSRIFNRFFKSVSRGDATNICVGPAKLKSLSNKQLPMQLSTTVHPQTENPLFGAKIEGSLKEAVEVEWRNGDVTHYPYLWLRDNCYCPLCKKFGRDVFLRDFSLQELNPDTTPKHVKVSECGEMVVTWDDGHVSSFSYDWLREYGFTPDKQKERLESLNLPLVLWNNATMQDKVPEVKFNDLLGDDHTLLNWLKTLEQIGLCLITNMPCKPGQLKKVGERVAFLRKSNYGETFSVKSKVSLTNLAYSTGSLSLHTDLPSYQRPPGMQMLHCISQVKSRGGENQLTDGFYVARKMEKEYPEYYKILCTLPVDYADKETDFYKFHKMSRHKTFSFHENGEIKQVFHGNHSRSPKLTVPVDKVQDLYKALKKYDDLSYSEECLITAKLRPGDCMCFHNNRVMHGRTGYIPTEPGERELEGGYIEWDELKSRRRVLQEELGL